ncbi:hypothetical protein ScPMuIL_006641 [Solemya velum]
MGVTEKKAVGRKRIPVRRKTRMVDKLETTEEFQYSAHRHNGDYSVMATNNAPKHDFAPAWLKIQPQENPKPSGSQKADHQGERQSKQRPHKDDNRSGPDYARLHRQHSFDNYYEGKRYPLNNHTSKFRHHSIDDDYYAFPYGYGYYDSYGYDGMHYNSQPSLFRPNLRDGKYQHPNARFGQVNGAYHGYYDLYPYEYYHGDPYYSSYPGNRGGSKRSYYEKEGRSNSKEGKEKENDKSSKERERKDKPVSTEDFPSLNGTDAREEGKSKPVNGSGVWDNPPLGKGPFDDCGEGKSHSSSNIYRVLLPNKGSLSKKSGRDGMRFNGGYGKDQSPFASKVFSNSAQSTSPVKENSRQSPTPPVEILNAKFVTHPKKLGDKKSEFLKALRKENSNAEVMEKVCNTDTANVDQEGNCDTPLRKSVEEMHVSERKLLSSSLEEEQRLLRMMGWKETDDEEYEITEDDMKYFQNLSKQVKQQPNGVVKPLPKVWSPSHVLTYTPTSLDLNETLSSDSDSDDSC